MKAVYSASLANLFHVTVFGRELARADGEAAGRIRAPGAAPGWAAGSTLPTGRLRGLRAPGALGYVLGTPDSTPCGCFGGVGLEGWGPARAAHRVLVAVVAPRRSRRGFRVPGLDRCQEARGFGVTPARGWAFARAPLVLVKQTGGERGRGRDRPG